MAINLDMSGEDFSDAAESVAVAKEFFTQYKLEILPEASGKFWGDKKFIFPRLLKS